MRVGIGKQGMIDHQQPLALTFVPSPASREGLRTCPVLAKQDGKRASRPLPGTIDKQGEALTAPYCPNLPLSRQHFTVAHPLPCAPLLPHLLRYLAFIPIIDQHVSGGQEGIQRSPP